MVFRSKLRLINCVVVALAICLTVSSCDTAEDDSASQPSQVNMHISFSGDVRSVERFAAELGRQLGLTMRHNVVDHGGRSGTLHIYSVYDANILVKVQSSIDDQCVDRHDAERRSEGYPVFSKRLYFVSIFTKKTTVSSQRVRNIAAYVREIARRHDGTLNPLDQDCRTL